MIQNIRISQVDYEPYQFKVEFAAPNLHAAKIQRALLAGVTNAYFSGISSLAGKPAEVFDAEDYGDHGWIAFSQDTVHCILEWEQDKPVAVSLRCDKVFDAEDRLDGTIPDDKMPETFWIEPANFIRTLLAVGEQL